MVPTQSRLEQRLTEGWHRLQLRLDAMSLRERVLLLMGVPLALVAAAEMLVFEPARKRSVELTSTIARQNAEIKALRDAVAQQPTLSALPAVDQLQKQRDELAADIEESRRVMAGVREAVDWGLVVRAPLAGNAQLRLTSLRALPPETVFSAEKLVSVAPKTSGNVAAAAATLAAANGKPTAPAATATAAQPALPAWAESAIYRHRAELTVQGDLAALQGYLQTLQRLPGALHWERLQLNVTEYPQAQATLAVYTLSNQAKTPFN